MIMENQIIAQNNRLSHINRPYLPPSGGVEAGPSRRHQQRRQSRVLAVPPRSYQSHAGPHPQCAASDDPGMSPVCLVRH